MSLLEITKKTAKERGMSLTDVATKAGIAQKSIYQWKTVTPKADTLKAVANVLGVTTDYLLGNTDDRIPNKNNTPSNEDLEDSLNSAVAYGGKPMTENDRAILKGLLKGYFEAKEDDKWQSTKKF